MSENRVKIVVGDENKDARFLIKVYLRDYNVDVFEARDGKSCLALIKEHSPELIFLDYILDKITGYELAELLAKKEAYKDIPVIIMTREGFDLIEDRCGVDEYLAKPFERDQFLNTIERLLGEDELPRKKMANSNKSEGEKSKESDKKAAGDSDGGKQKILIADDEKNILKLLEVILSGKYELEMAETGVELFNKAKEDSYDLIISDVVMPKLSGWKSVKKIREAGIDVPVIFNSGLVKDKKLYETLKPEGPSAFILKPFKKQQVLTKVKEMLKK
ncbi:MAG: response regulator [Elusimicrobiota bacterium]